MIIAQLLHCRAIKAIIVSFLILSGLTCFVINIENREIAKLTTTTTLKNATLISPPSRNYRKKEETLVQFETLVHVQHEHQSKPPPTNQTNTHLNAVVHIGPHKTGTTSIQGHSVSLVQHLANDNYEMPWSHSTNSSEPRLANQVNVATCFFGTKNNPLRMNVFQRKIPVNKEFPCRKDLLESGLEIAQRKHSIFISAETFDHLRIDGVAALAEYLRPWNNVTIAVTYRRFYDWIISYHNQLSKGFDWKMFHLNETDKLRPSIYDALTNTEWFETIKERYTLFLASRFRKHFRNVVIMNYHDNRTETSEQLYCNVMPQAPNTCGGMKNITRRNELKRRNKSSTLVYEDIAYAAHRMGVIHMKSKEQYFIVRDAIQNHQERFLNLTSNDFSPKCPPKYVVDKLWEISFLAEEELLLGPAASSNPTVGKDEMRFELRADFEKHLKTDGLCEVDIATTLASSVWKEFFEHLQHKLVL